MLNTDDPSTRRVTENGDNSMYKRLIAASLIVLFALVSPAGAITNGQPDQDNQFPYVGMVTFYNATWNYLWRCSGALLSPTVFLTAGHCTAPDPPDVPVHAKVWLNWDLAKLTYPYEYPNATYPNVCGPYPDKCWTGTPYHHPNYASPYAHGLPGFITHDVGVVVLDSSGVPVGTLGQYADLPDEGVVDTLPMRTTVMVVGYGVQHRIRGAPPNPWVGLRVRYFAPSLLIQSNDVISDEFMKLTANPAQGKGGTCFGDSGGPDLLGGTRTVLAVTSFGTNYNCAGVGYYYRIDTADALNFINACLGGECPKS